MTCRPPSIVRPAQAALLLALLLATPTAALAQAPAAAPTAASAQDAAAPAIAADGAAAGHPDDALYDLRPLEVSQPALAPLMKAWRARRYKRVIKLAPRALANTNKATVEVAIRYMVARAQDKRRQPAAAEKAWLRIAQAGPLADRARLRLADLALARDDTDAAIARLAAVARWHVDRPTARLRIAELELDRGRVAPAAAVLEGLDPAAMTSGDAVRWRLLAGDVARRRGDEAGAAQLYLTVWRARTGASSSAALERLAAMGHPPLPMDQVEMLIESAPRRTARGRRGRRQRRALQERLHAAAAGVPGLMEYGAGLLHARRRSGREAAAASWQEALTLAEDAAVQGRVRYVLGDILGRMNRDQEAISVLEPLLAERIDPALKIDAAWRLHRLYNAVKRPLDVDRMLQLVVAGDAPGTLRHDATWAQAWRRFQVGDCAEAMRLFDVLAADGSATFNRGRQSWRARARYWQGRCHDRAGRSREAMASWQEVVDSHPLTWYGALALDRIRERDADLAKRLLGQAPAAADGATPEPRLENLRVRRDRSLDEAALLTTLGEHVSARGQLRRQLGAGMSSGGVHLLATLYKLHGRPRMALASLQRYAKDAARPDPGTVAVWREAYPTPWRPEFELAAKEAQIPRALLYAVARHESSFVPTARSNAGAIGLIQVLPIVASRIAELYGLPATSKGKLRKPATNLAVGARYLAELQRFYVGNQPLALAGYNAGPYAVQKWLVRTGVVATDAFVESIPYVGARRYVMRVGATAQSYAWLYPEWNELHAIASGRRATVPARLGPFMQRPDKETSLLWPAPAIARPRRIAALHVP